MTMKSDAFRLCGSPATSVCNALTPPAEVPITMILLSMLLAPLAYLTEARECSLFLPPFLHAHSLLHEDSSTYLSHHYRTVVSPHWQTHSPAMCKKVWRT